MCSEEYDATRSKRKIQAAIARGTPRVLKRNRHLLHGLTNTKITAVAGRRRQLLLYGQKKHEVQEEAVPAKRIARPVWTEIYEQTRRKKKKGRTTANNCDRFRAPPIRLNENKQT